MELGDGTTDIVHPEVRAHISSLVAAVGSQGSQERSRLFELPGQFYTDEPW